MADLDLLKLREIAIATTGDAWFSNLYAGIFRADKTHSKWQTEKFEEGHTLERTGDCPQCPDTKYGCSFYGEDYELNPLVCGVPPKFGDTAIGTHARDLDHIEAFDPPTAIALLDRINNLSAPLRELEKDLIADVLSGLRSMSIERYDTLLAVIDRILEKRKTA